MDTGQDASKEVVQKPGEFLGNEIVGAVLLKTLATQTRSNDDKIVKQEPVEEIIIPSGKRDILNKLRSIIQMKHYKKSKLLNDSTVWKFVINVKATANTDIKEKDVAFKNNAQFRWCITKINSTLIDNAEDVMPMYNLLKYSQNYSITSEVYGIIVEIDLK